MEHYAGIDVALERSSVCVVDSSGRIIREIKVASEPEALVGLFAGLGVAVTRIGLEAGPLWQWLHAGLTGAGLEAVLLETRQVQAALSAMVVKTDRPSRASSCPRSLGRDRIECAALDGRPRHRPALADGLVPPRARQVASGKLLDVALSIRGILRGFGLKLGEVGTGRFAARVRELVAGQPMLERVVEPMLRAREALRAAYRVLHRAVLAIVREDATCRRLMGVPGVGALVAITFTSAVDDPARFRRSRAVGAHFGLTPKKYQSGATDVTGGISKVGDAPREPPPRLPPLRDRMIGAADHGPHRSLRGSQGDADPSRPVLDLDAVGAGCGAASGHAAGAGGAGAQAGDRAAPPLGRPEPVPLRPAGGCGVIP